jgi:surfactin synthase thioesterase subunit
MSHRESASDLRLFLLHHAGGSRLLYSTWPDRFPQAWQVHALDVPGRDDGGHSLDAVTAARRIADVTEPMTDRPYALFGHSMGAAIAFELALALRSRGRPWPVWIGLSACTPDPRAMLSDGGPLLHASSDRRLREHLARLGGTPSEILTEEHIWRSFAPRIRADLRLVESWQPAPPSPVPAPVTLFGGLDDPYVRPDMLGGWARVATRILGVHLYAGGHFYLVEHTEEVVERTVTDIHRVRD